MSDTYKKLNNFISKDMKMSHIYQPLMLIELLKNNGTSTITDVAKALLLKDISQIEYYENITKNMVGKVLTNNRKITTKDKNSYSLLDYDKLSQQEIESLINLCVNKISDYTNKRGDDIWSHRKKSKGYISGSTRYEVLKNAKFHCQLCGISAEKKALEVDHIVPRNLGGTDEQKDMIVKIDTDIPMLYFRNKGQWTKVFSDDKFPKYKYNKEHNNFTIITGTPNTKEQGKFIFNLLTKTLISEGINVVNGESEKFKFTFLCKIYFHFDN